MRTALILLVALAGAAAAQGPQTSLNGDDIVVVAKPNTDPCGIARQVFVSPVGQPFRALPGDPEPVGRWFDATDLDHDGALDAAEMRADADRWFVKADRNHDGEIDPDEMVVYERDTVPEVSIYRRTAADRAAVAEARRRGKPLPYGTPVGAARFALLNIPHPLASADQDYNRGITRGELEAVADKAFAALAKGKAFIARTDLPLTPQQAHIRKCAAKKGEKRVRDPSDVPPPDRRDRERDRRR